MENPLKNAKDFFNQEDYDRLAKEGVTEFAEYSSLPVPDDPDPKPNTATSTSPQATQSPPVINPNVTPTTTQRGSTSRRDFIWGSLVLGVAAIGGIAYFSRREQSPAVPTPVAKIAEAQPTLTPVLPTQAPTATINLRPVEAVPTRSFTLTPTLIATETPRPTNTPTLEPTKTPTLEPTREIPEMEKKAKEILGSDFLGYEAIKELEKRLSTSSKSIEFFIENLSTFPYTIRDLELAKENNEMLVLRSNGISSDLYNNGILSNKVGPFTLTGFWGCFTWTGNDSLLYIAHSDDWSNMPLSTGEGEISAPWALVKKEPLNNSINKTWDQQEDLIRQYGQFIKKQGGSQTNVRRRSATETVWDITIDQIVNNRNQMLDIWDWTRTPVRDGRFIYVRRFKSNPQMLEMHATSLKDLALGVYPMR